MRSSGFEKDHLEKDGAEDKGKEKILGIPPVDPEIEMNVLYVMREEGKKMEAKDFLEC